MICLIEPRDNYLIIISSLILINSYISFTNEKGGNLTSHHKIKLESPLKVEPDKIQNIESWLIPLSNLLQAKVESMNHLSHLVAF